MQHRRKKAGLLKSALLGAATLGAISFAGVGVAQAGPLFGTVSMTIYNYTCTNGGSSCSSSSTSQQALYSTIADLPTDSQVSNLTSATGTYTGPIDFQASSPTISNFLASSGGTNTFSSTFLSKTLSTSHFKVTSLFDITFTPTTDITGGSIAHDDGASLYAASNTSTDLVPTAAADPTTLETTPIPTTLNAGTTYELIYVEANGLPAQLNLSGSGKLSVPEPGSLALLGTGLLGLGLVARRRRRKA